MKFIKKSFKNKMQVTNRKTIKKNKRSVKNKRSNKYIGGNGDDSIKN